MFSTYLYEGSSQRTRIRNDVKLGDGPENGTQLHLTGDNLTDSAPVASTITNNNSVAVSTSVKKYGTGSIEFNSGSANQTLQFDQSSDMKFPDGKSDFTVGLDLHGQNRKFPNYVFSGRSVSLIY